MALLVIAGTSGAGKGTIVSRLRARDAGLWYSVSATSRVARPGEVDGADYVFLDRAEFERRRDAGGFLESFEVYGNLYGTPARPVEDRLDAGEDVVLELDVQGALAVKERIPGATLVFVRAPSPAEQRRRLEDRGEPEDVIERRMAADADYEAQVHLFDHVVINDDLDRAVADLSAILKSSRRQI